MSFGTLFEFICLFEIHKGANFLKKPNYKHDKQQKEIAKQKKKEKKLDKKNRVLDT